jgi:hypothetical protein
MQAALEAEITEFLGRGLRGRPAGFPQRVPGKTTAGPAQLSRPKLRGLPVRAVDAALAEAPGEQGALSKSAARLMDDQRCGPITGGPGRSRSPARLMP